jgi:hypothetical protein
VLFITIVVAMGRRPKVQSGKIYGVGLIILGIVLCALQFVQYMAPPTEHVTSSLPGIIGAGSLVAGIALFITAPRRDEPDSKSKVR